MEAPGKQSLRREWEGEDLPQSAMGILQEINEIEHTHQEVSKEHKAIRNCGKDRKLC